MTKPTNIDNIVGQNIARRRIALKISQSKLGEHLGITFQQVQKYEKASNRISAGALYKIAEFLKCSVVDLYAGCDAPENSHTPPPSAKDYRLALSIGKIEDRRLRSAMVDLAHVLSGVPAISAAAE